ncbi:MAG: DUF302 domain-containing protein [Zetaproteobacteria bacterium]|nr:MAG: DUF302 domain-containing protein [Zetaproteobacteria bacterium]
MSKQYGFDMEFPGTIEQAEQAITDSLREVGFGVLTRIDVAATLRKKLGLDRRPYLILGACNPKIAAQALEMEEHLGLLLPCNVVIYQDAKDRTIVSVIDPVAMLSVVGNPELDAVARDVAALLKQALAALTDSASQ